MSASSQFSWHNFDPATLEAFSRVLDYDGPSNPGSRAEFLATIYHQPTTDFVSKTFAQIQHSWLRRNENITAGLVDALIKNGVGPRERPRDHKERTRFISQCNNRNVFRQYFLKALLKYGSGGSWTTESSFELETAFPRLSIIKPLEQSGDIRAPYDYQRRAWDELNLQLTMAESTGRFEGFLVMPTGSGKTFTSARWLMENHINHGGRVLWLAHRHELLEQAAQAFAASASLAKNIDEIRIRIVSGLHSPSAAIGPTDTVVCASIQSLARNPDVVSELLADERIFLVVDEAHHASAKSYRDIIEELRAKDRYKILGLTATPTRTIIHEQPVLSRLFGNKRIFEIQTRDLIEKGFLSRPIPVTVKTNADVTQDLSPSDYSHLQSFNDLSEDWKNRIANITERNAAITKHYLENCEKYGKTLVFAINIPHAELLCEHLREAGVKTDYVASARLNGDPYDKREIISQFRNPNSDFDILINVMILTEGVDIPNIKTVFLTRPVQSEILLRQMVGRALRGPAAGGTKEAYLVSFQDRWRQFEEWERPLELIHDIIDLPAEKIINEGHDTDTIPVPDTLTDFIPWELIRKTAIEIRNIAKYGDVSAFEAIPSGWYVVEQQDDEDITRTLVPVYEHQRSSWEALFADLESGSDSLNRDVKAIRDEYFFDCDPPRPAAHEIDRVIAFMLSAKRRPEYQSLDGRDICDPSKIAEILWEDQLGPREERMLIERRYESPLAKAIFSTFEEFESTVLDERKALMSQKLGRKPRLASVVFSSWGSDFLAPGPYHDLPGILKRVLDKAREFRDFPGVLWNGSIHWTRRPMMGWYAKADWESGTPKGSGVIRANTLIDSPDISVKTLEFLVWHEYLHLLLQSGHTPVFNRFEKRWPGIRDAERELATLNERFELSFYW